MRAGSALLIVTLAVWAVPSVEAGPFVGDEADPELADAAGDVSYSPANVGPQDHHYVDLLAAWIQYNGTRDTVAVSIKLQDTKPLERPPANWGISCNFWAAAVLGETPNGEFQFNWTTLGHTDRVSSQATWWEETEGTQGGSHRVIPHSFLVNYSTPGTVVFELERVRLLQWADTVRGFRADCVETFSPTPTSPPTVIVNGDNAVSTDNGRTFSVGDLRPAGVPEEAEPTVSDSTSSSPDTTPNGTPAGSVAITMLLVSSVAVFIRRK